MKTKHTILVIIYFLFLVSVQAKETYKFRTMSPEGGLSYNGVKEIKQDYNGFIWIVMEDEIYRFDGYTYKRHSPYFIQVDPTVEWIFSGIVLDNSGNLYVNTNKGIFKYDHISEEFINIYDEHVNTIFFDNRNNFWIRKNYQWGILDQNTKEIKKPLYDGEQTSYTGSVYCMHGDDLYLFSNYGRIYKYNYVANEFTLCSIMPEGDGYVSEARIYKGKLWVLIAKYGLYKLDLTTFAVEAHYPRFYEDLNAQRITFYIDKKGTFWIGTIYGIRTFNPETEEVSHYTHSEFEPFSLPNNSVWNINGDREGNIWIGTYSGAVCYVNLDEENTFETYLPHLHKLSSTPVSAFAEDKDYIWVGTEGGGINRVNKKNNEFTYYTDDSQSYPKLAFNNIKSLVIDKNSNLWIGMYRGGIDCFDTKTNKIKNFKSARGENSLRYDDIRKLVLENESGLWIAYQRQNLLVSYYSFKTEEFIHIDFSEDNGNAYIFDVLRGRENQLWILTKEKLYVLDVHSHKVRAIEPNDSIYLNFNTMCMDVSGNIWIGTIGNGLIKYNPNTSEFEQYRDVLQQNVSSIFNICYDVDDNLWLGTDNGLVRYDIKQNHFLKFDKEDGVQGQVYYPLATMKSLDGKLYFGGTNGFTIINPKELSWNMHRPKVIISNFFIDHISTKLNFSNLDEKKEIVLKYNQANFGFKFSSDNYLIPEKNSFKYRLRGYDDRWVGVDAGNRTAQYSKVPAGTYYFEILAANNDGVWNDEPTVIKIRRKPAPWFSWPAYLLYFALIAAVIFFILRYYHAKKSLELQLYMENVEKEKKEAIHQSQLSFFTNISHDFRTPLSLIIASLEKLRQEGLKEYYYNILNNNARRLLNLVNELMDFRTVENGKMKLEVRPVNVNSYVQELGADFIDYAQQRSIDYRIVCDSNLPEWLYVDKNILEKVVMNLLNNAFKYTKPGGQIILETRTMSFESGYENSFVVKGDKIPQHTFLIVVRDNGVGITKDSIQSVFERFYKLNTINFDSHLGTGIGLALVKSLVLLHKGMISVCSERGKGTDIAVFLSTDKSTYDAMEIVSEIPEDENENELDIEEEESSTIDEMLNDDMERLQKKNNKKILLAEDNEDLRNIIADFLSDEYDVIQAEDGVEASKLLSKKVIDLIISDIMMPRKDGITFSREVKENVETSHIPVILLTAKTSIESKLEGADSGADIYFEKPVDLQLLKLSIQNVFKYQQQLREYYAKNHFANSSEVFENERDNKFIQDFINIIEENLDHPEMDVNYIASQLLMSRSKLYRKIKTMTGQSIIEFILSYKLKKAARLIIEGDMSIREIMDEIGIESQPYFTNAFKKKFGETPSAFAAKHKKT